MKSFIEVQFPISRLSKECYKERMAGAGQTLTGLGKWWGRKPLILVRATLLGLLMPASDNHKKDMDIFLKILTMDDDGLWLRCKNKRKFSREEFYKLDYEERLKYCIRPEEVESLPKEYWSEINSYLNTNASNIQEFIQELGKIKFGNIPRVADVFCGGGSIPFEAARMGCEVYASDLNPIAGLLTWASLNILSKSDEEIKRLKEFQQRVYDKVKKEIDELGIEKNEKGWTAEYYLYCNETVCPHCGVRIPLAPSWVISTKYKTVAKLKLNNLVYDIEIKDNVTANEMKEAQNGTTKRGKIICPNCHNETPISAVRGDRQTSGGIVYGFRMWGNDDVVPREDDVFQERLYCIRYTDDMGRKYYCTPTKEDFQREEKVLAKLKKNFKSWQKKGYIPIEKIQDGEKTREPVQTRGWTFWHHLFNPRQLLTLSLLNRNIEVLGVTIDEKVVGLIGINRLINMYSKINIWNTGRDESEQVFTNQALNTMYNYPSRCMNTIKNNFITNFKNIDIKGKRNVDLKDARNVDQSTDIIITDPPYADAVNYHELTEYFLAWAKGILPQIFPEWYIDSKRVLAVQGIDEIFRSSMTQIYKNLTEHMTNDGYQVIMFTHQDVTVWSDLVPIIIKSGLQVCQAWTISTETESGGLKNSGNYVKGSVILVLKKRSEEEGLFEDELREKLRDEVEKQIKFMGSIDFYKNFNDQDYILCSYAMGLKVLTSNELIDIDLDRELKKREENKRNKIDELLEHARHVAASYLIPSQIDKRVWDSLTISEKFYIKGLQSEFNGQITVSTYQELARTFEVKEYIDYLQNTRANEARLKTASELKSIMLHNDGFGSTLLRNVMYAIYESVKHEDINRGRELLKINTDYVRKQREILGVLDFLSTMGSNTKLAHWNEDSKYAKLLYQFIANDGV